MSVFLGIGAAQLSQQRNGGARGALGRKNHPETRALSLGLPHQKSNFRINHEKHMYLVGGFNMF